MECQQIQGLVAQNEIIAMRSCYIKLYNSVKNGSYERIVNDCYEIMANPM